MAEGKIPIRNIVLLGHSHAGKTQLGEALLAAGGAISQAGKVEQGTTQSDYNEDEKERKISINASLLNLTKDGVKVNIIDAPGYGDFIGEALCAIRASDGAVIVVNAVSGIEIGTNNALKLIEASKTPAIIFVNKIDKENADFDKCLGALQTRLGKKCAALSSPMSEAFVEAVAESDDELLEKYLDKGELSEAELGPALTKAILECKIIPVMSGSASSGKGVKELLDFIIAEMPSPADFPPEEATDPKTNEKISVSPVTSDFPSAQVFKTISDPYVGQISLFRIFSGKISSNTPLYNTSQGSSEKIGQLLTLCGKKEKPISEASAGDIACCAKLKNTHTGDSLATEKKQVLFKELQFPAPAISFSIKPKTRSDEDKISAALHKLTAEDMTFKILRDPQTKELIVSGMGDLHVTIMIKRLSARFGVQVDMGTPKVAYKETITGKGDAHYKHKKQSGGAGQFAEVWLRVESLPRGTGFEFVDEVVGGAIPGPFIVSCEKGIKSAMGDGALAGFPLIDVRAVVYDGKTHPVDSKDIAFQIASKHGFKEAILKAKPVLLEPIMEVDVTIPDEFMGDITGSLNSRRGRIMGMEPGVGIQVVKAKVPLEEMYKWANELKSLTGGRGSYSMRFLCYETVPSNVAQTIIDKFKKAKEEAKA
jgi:elongation factor G